MDKHIQKRNKSIFELAEQAVDCIVISNLEPGDRNFYALTGARGRFVYSLAVVYEDGSVQLLIDELEQPDAKRAGLDHVIYTSENLQKLLCSSLKGKRIGINDDLFPMKLAYLLRSGGFEPVMISDLLNLARLKKTEAELDCIRKACDIVSAIAREIPSYPIQSGMSEFDLQAEIDYRMTKLGSEEPAFTTLVAFGENSANPHHLTSNSKLQAGDLILIDYGATVGHVVSDITRTFCFGTTKKWQKDLYRTVLSAQLKALANLAVGVDGSSLYRGARRTIKNSLEKLGLEGDMTHALGHSIGYFLHDGARLAVPEFIIPEGLVTTVEPGGYIEGKGGVRIEDDVIVSSRGIEVLTERAPKEKLVVIQ